MLRFPRQVTARAATLCRAGTTGLFAAALLFALSGPAPPGGGGGGGGPTPGDPTPLPPPDNPPQIVDFIAYPSLDIYVFEGTVIDDNPGVMTITFGEYLEGHSTPVSPDGSFYYSVYVPPGVYDFVTAVTWNEHGLESNTAWEIVDTTDMD